MKYLCIFIFSVCLCMNVCCSQQEKKGIRWPNGAKAAICLTYDDAMTTHLEFGLPALDSVGLKGTFFLNPTRSRDEILGWMAAAEKGHELGNHSVLHPCPKNMGWPDKLITDDYTVKQILNEVAVQNKFLETLDADKTFRTYAYPCSNTMVGGLSYSKALKESKLIRFARTGGNENSIITDFDTLNYFEVPSYEVQEYTKGEALISYVKKVIDKKGFGVFMFHGINGQWFNVPSKEHRMLLEYLKDQQKDVWVATFAEIMTHIESQSKKGLK